MFKNIKSVYIIGIGGISMSAIALLLQERGIIVKGSDAVISSMTKKLQEKGIEIIEGSAPDFVMSCDAVLATAAAAETHPDIILARMLNKKIFSRAEVLGFLCKNKKTISVAGTHGKTTTTGMIATIMLKAGLDPTIHIGGILNEINSNLHVGKGEYFLTEACEYKDSFLYLKSDISVILNVEADHMDYFKNIDNLNNSFKKFAKNTKKEGVCVVCDSFSGKMASNSVKMATFGKSSSAMLKAGEIAMWKEGRYSYNLYLNDEYVAKIYLSAFGQHNIQNSLAAVWVGILLGIDIQTIAAALKEYKGVSRRMEQVCDWPLIIHDYAHHPTEIEATIKACKEIKSKVVAIFQPHTYTRTRDLYNDFLSCFGGAEEVWLLPIYPAREKPIKNITSENLSKDLDKMGIKSRYFSSFEECAKAIIQRGEESFYAILGAGDIEKLAIMMKNN